MLATVLAVILATSFADDSLSPRLDMSLHTDARASPQMQLTQNIGDMKFTDAQWKIIKEREAGIQTSVDKRINLRWKDAVIPYVIDCSIKHLPTSVWAVEAAMEEWEKKTCIRFVKHTNQKFKLTFFKDTHCWGNVGQVSYSHISVGDGCDYQHVMTHEIGHVVGMYHEQNRMDRDQWVNVHWENIGQFDSAFRKEKMGVSLGVKYDYESIMHYPWSAFSSNGQDTMSPKKSTNQVPYVALSKLDALQTSLMYDCPKVEKERKEKGQSFLNMPLRVRNRVKVVPVNDAEHQGVASATCSNKHSSEADCETWRKAGFCREHEYVKLNCRKSCFLCGGAPCTNLAGDKSCEAWAKGGACAQDYIAKEHCQKTCAKYCEGTIPTQPPTQPPPPTNPPQTDAPTQPPKTQPPQTDAPTNPQTAGPTNPQTDGPTNPPTAGPTNPPTAGPTNPPTAGPTNPQTAGPTNPPTAAPTGPQPTNPPKPDGDKVFMGIGILCEDTHPKCAEWARAGECEANPWWMTRNCMKSCPKSRCDKVPQKPDDTCADSLGLGYDGSKTFRLSDSAFYSPDHTSPGSGWEAAAQNARLYYRDDHDKKRIAAWCATENQINGDGSDFYMQVDLQQQKTIKYIATQGRDRYFEHVKAYAIKYSDDGRTYNDYTENGKVKVFDGSCDHFTPVLNKFTTPISARYIRVYPKDWNYPCMRMELFGC